MPPIVLALSLLLAACAPPPKFSSDVTVVGAGIAGLAAALEAADNGANVIVVDINTVGGGHAVKAGGLAMVNTQLQRAKGIEDSPELATAELLAWGEDADPHWVKAYAEDSGSEVYDWLTDFGVDFRVVLPTPESSVARFHFTRGTAVHVVLPMLSAALKHPRIQFLWHSAADSLLVSDEGAVVGIGLTNLRGGARYQVLSKSVILATGGFQSNRQLVLQHWPQSRPAPDKLLTGSGAFALGHGYALAAAAGGVLNKMEQQVTFVNGIPNPRDESGESGLTIEQRGGMLINQQGKRFVSETAPAKEKELAVFAHAGSGHWLVFDSAAARKTIVRGALWLNPQTIQADILNNDAISLQAGSLDELATQTGLPADALANSVSEFNQTARRPIAQAPYYAVRLHWLTRKSLGGPSISHQGAVMNESNKPVPGLFAAGELTGVAGINGSFGGSGTFLGPSVYTGRIAGRSAAVHDAALPASFSDTERLALDSDGYWHYKVSHEVIRERAIACDTCHQDTPMTGIGTNSDMLNRLPTCTQCH